MYSDRLIINDPVYGFIPVPRGLLADILAHPFFQRMDRIRQLGMSATVYPGAQHTRKQHSLGAFHLMQEAFITLTEKGVFLFDSEKEGALASILLHDVGHGPYSHVLEKVLIRDISHEDISLLMMERINAEMRGALNLAIKIFTDGYHKRFIHDLICSQLDVDRLDYLCRDSFYTGVREGNIGAARLIRTMNVADDRIVIDAKGLYSVENYLMARRLMYWQVYLHKTVVSAEEVLRSALKRAKYLSSQGETVFCSPALRYFLYNDVDSFSFRESTGLDYYAQLDDSDILCALKVWQRHPDKILSTLSSGFINRRLFKVDIYDSDIPEELMGEYKSEIAREMGIPVEDADYFVTTRTVKNEMYSVSSEGIGILAPDGSVHDIAGLSHIVREEVRDLPDKKVYVFRQRV